MQSCVHICLVRLTVSLLQEWFSTSVLLFASELPRASATSPGIQVSSEGIPAMPESSVQALMQLAQEFEELANTCLLVLHLEVRYMAVTSTHLRYACHLRELARTFSVHATLFGELLVEANDKHACIFHFVLLNMKADGQSGMLDKWMLDYAWIYQRLLKVGKNLNHYC